jgi:hypothetical protein
MEAMKRAVGKKSMDVGIISSQMDILILIVTVMEAGLMPMVLGTLLTQADIGQVIVQDGGIQIHQAGIQ